MNGYGEKLLTPEEKKAAIGKKLDRLLLETGAYIGLFFLTLLLFWVVKPLVLVERNGVVAQSIMAIGATLILAFIAYMGITKRLTMKRFLLLILLLGYLVRMGYMLYTPASVRQQDTYSSRFNGHEAYAWTIFKTGKLPATNDYQFYHPPLNALAQAGFMRLMQGLTDGVSAFFGLGEYFPAEFTFGMPEYIAADRYYLYSTCQILSTAYSFLAAVTLVKILFLFNFSEKTKGLLSLFVVFYPRQIQFAGMLNNDGLSYLLAALSLYYALRWQKEGRGLGKILLTALFVGLGMMTKLSSATICLPIAGVFLWELVAVCRKSEGAMSWKSVFLQYGLFLLVCASIGLWFQVYAKARFDQSFGFVFSNLNHKLYTGDHSFFERFIFPFDWTEWFGSIYCRPFEGNYYLFNYALRSSIFGEFSYWQGEGFAVTAIFTAYLSAAFLFASLLFSVISYFKSRDGDCVLRRAGVEKRDLLFVFLLVQSQVLSEIYFYLQMPYGCTMDFRYIMPLILGMALTLGYTRKILAADGGRTAIFLNRGTALSVAAFLLSSTLFYFVAI